MTVVVFEDTVEKVGVSKAVEQVAVREAAKAAAASVATVRVVLMAAVCLEVETAAEAWQAAAAMAAGLEGTVAEEQSE